MKFAIQTKNLRKTFPTTPPIKALENINLNIYENEFLTILGPSGCGKSTFLRILAGFESYEGELTVHDKQVTKPSPDRFVVHQDTRQLLPWKTVFQNIEFGLKINGTPEDERNKIVTETISLVGLTGFEKMYPHELSGGMQQRVAIGRALVMNPSVLLMDEPFGSLDAPTRRQLQTSLLEIWIQIPKTIIFITHNIRESILLGDRVVLMDKNPGRILNIFEITLKRPRNSSTEEFVKLYKEIVSKFPFEK